MGLAGGARRALISSVAVIGAAGLSLLRQVGAGALNTVYAEDGTVFLADAYRLSTLDALSTPYAGYLHTVPRLLAEVVSALPVSAAASGLAVSAALVTGLLAVLVYFASGTSLTSPWARALASAVVVLVPVGQEEIPNSIANLHWPMLYALFWVLLWEPAARWLKPIVVLLIVLSDILTVVFLPLALWRWWKKRDHVAYPTRQPPNPQPLSMAAFGVGLAVQASAVLFGQSERAFTPEPVMWAPWWVIRAVPTGFLGERWFGTGGVDTRWLLLAGVAWVVLLGFVLASWKSASWKSLTWKGLVALAIIHCVAVYALPVALSGQATSRYAAAPAMLLIAALAVLLFEGKPKPTAVGIAFVVLCAAVWGANLRVPNSRSVGPMWSDQIQTQACEGGQVSVQVSPRDKDWKLAVPCGR
ncbi:MAG TPA: hypothetical protein VFC19_34300 [Candidatus Limnocylindrales bacterium]|nr:hypothetical protein [Candidatus Limnocylindrales bacterium]